MTGVTLRLNTDRWRAHQQRVAQSAPGLVPVAKGNGYGFGLRRLAEEAQLLGADTLAVGLPGEVAAVRDVFAGDIVILNPWRPDDPGAAELARDPRVITTVSRLEDLEILANLSGSRPDGTTTPLPRVLIEAQTSMLRHGIPTSDLEGVEALAAYVAIEGWTIHLPIPTDGEDNLEEAARLALACQSARPGPLWLSHLPAERIGALTGRLPEPVSVRLRIGTRLWLGEPDCLETTATVLDVHRVRRGDRAGYRQRRIPSNGWLVIVSGGTAHGIGMEAPTSATTVRQRAIALASGGLEAAGHALGPYTLDGKKRWFLEPPHMQSSMVLLPEGATPPEVGDEVPVELRLTTALVDQVVDAPPA